MQKLICGGDFLSKLEIMLKYNIGKDFGNNKYNFDRRVKWCQVWLNLCLNRRPNGLRLWIYEIPRISVMCL